MTISSIITNYGISEELQGIFNVLREMPAATDLNRLKFKSDDIDKLAQHLVCRNYGKICLELSYLCWAVINNAPSPPHCRRRLPPLLEYFWQLELLSVNKVRQHFTQPVGTTNSPINIEGSFLRLNPKGASFDIGANRISLLAALLEFIVYVDPQQLTKLEQQLVGAGDPAIKSVASGLQQLIYQFLSAHLSTAQLQRRFRYMANYLEQAQCVDIDNWLNDQLVLDFWLTASGDESGLGFKLYRNSLIELVNFHQALYVAKTQIQARGAQSIGDDYNSGELPDDLLQQQVVELQQELPALDWLCLNPKFMTKAQLSLLMPVIELQPLANNLCHSLARAFVFGNWQATIVQASRQGREADKLALLPKDNYIDYYQKLVKGFGQLIQSLLALLHINHQHQQPQLFGLINQLVTSPDLVAELKSLVKVHLTDDEPDINLLFNQLAQLQLVQPELNKLLQRAQAAFETNNKTGFSQLPPITELAVYQQGQETLLMIKGLLTSFINEFKQLQSDHELISSKISSDTSIFSDKFNRLYGVAND